MQRSLMNSDEAATHTWAVWECPVVYLSACQSNRWLSEGKLMCIWVRVFPSLKLMTASSKLSIFDRLGLCFFVYAIVCSVDDQWFVTDVYYKFRLSLQISKKVVGLTISKVWGCVCCLSPVNWPFTAFFCCFFKDALYYIRAQSAHGLSYKYTHTAAEWAFSCAAFITLPSAQAFPVQYARHQHSHRCTLSLFPHTLFFQHSLHVQ